ncbi:hypothetical protein [Sphingopyxis sp. PET50]|uniref:hypothetical protein n=1 Tax=Sphingopyxis sp. PET50 TaxID=2976533 RepID=UPI0021AF7DC3|nr:hypothetical protein [Sphingopyxis sp. PET50]
MARPLSATMVACIDFAAEHGGLVRMQGGYWTKRGAGWRGDAPDAEWFGTTTVHACVTRGELQYSEYHRGVRNGRFPIAANLPDKEKGAGQ